MVTSKTNKGDFELLDNNSIDENSKKIVLEKKEALFKLIKYQNRNVPAKLFCTSPKMLLPSKNSTLFSLPAK